MKNIRILPTDKPSRLTKNNLGKFIKLNSLQHQEVNENQHIYITSDEEIKDGWSYDRMMKSIGKRNNVYSSKIILTTDQDLIADGVQAIDDEFLEWFVKNPSCEAVEVIKEDAEQPKPLYPNGNHKGERVWIETYKIIIPKEEREQETLEEAAESYAKPFDNRFWVVATFKDGAKWQQKRMYSEEDIENIWNEFVKELPPINNGASSDFLLYLKQFKKK